VGNPKRVETSLDAWELATFCRYHAGHKKAAPPGQPESVNHNKPPSYHICEIFRVGSCRDDYSKPRDAGRILRGKDLTVAANRCPELKAFLNANLTLSDADPL
jgi:hypothetical protein